MGFTKYKGYPEYKDSGVEWNNKFPTTWDKVPLKKLFFFKKGKNSQLLTNEYIMNNAGPFPVYSGQTENNGIMGNINSYEYEYKNVIFSTTVGAKAMTPMFIGGKFNLSQNCMIMIAKNNHFSQKFVYYQINPIFKYLDSQKFSF